MLSISHSKTPQKRTFLPVMDDSDDEYSRSHGETLTFVDPEDDGVSIGNTQDSQFAYEQFSVPTQSSQVENCRICVKKSKENSGFC